MSKTTTTTGPTPYILARQKTDFKYLAGIDPGTSTGLAVKKRGEFILIKTVTIIEAILFLKKLAATDTVFVKIEDARLRTFFGKSGPEKWKGAGSIKRDCNIWEEAMEHLGIPYEMIHPKHVKETTGPYFKQITKWPGVTSKHSREAAWMIL